MQINQIPVVPGRPVPSEDEPFPARPAHSGVVVTLEHRQAGDDDTDDTEEAGYG